MGSNDCARAVLIDESRGQTNQGSLVVLGKLTHGVVFAVGCAVRLGAMVVPWRARFKWFRTRTWVFGKDLLNKWTSVPLALRITIQTAITIQTTLTKIN